MSSEKLQKVLARAGLGSRREMERRIEAGRVQVNGHRATLGDRVEPGARIHLDGRPVSAAALAPTDRRVIVYHKPTGELVTRSDPEGRRTVFRRLPPLRSGRWLAVGRLDINTSGLLLLTTDGELANRLAHPSYRLVRDYAVRIFGQLDEATLRRLTEGVTLEDGPAAFESILPLDAGEAANSWYRVRLREGKNRLVRRLWESQGVQVSRLMRVQYGPIEMPAGLREGQVKALTAGEVRHLAELVDLGDEGGGDRAHKRHRPPSPRHGGRRPGHERKRRG